MNAEVHPVLDKKVAFICFSGKMTPEVQQMLVQLVACVICERSSAKTMLVEEVLCVVC